MKCYTASNDLINYTYNEDEQILYHQDAPYSSEASSAMAKIYHIPQPKKCPGILCLCMNLP